MYDNRKDDFMKITIYGGASSLVNPDYISEGEEFGKLLVKRGHSAVYGGGARGLMGAVARGVKEEGGYILGISPKLFENTDGELFTDCDEFIFTESMRERKFLLEEYGDAFVVLPGGAGTFEELFEAFTLKQIGEHTKPIVIYNMNHYYDVLVELLNHAMEEKFIRETNLELFKVVDNAKDVLDYIEGYHSQNFVNQYRG